MTEEEAKSCIGTIEMLQRLAYNIHGVMDVIDANNCKKIIKALEQESCEDCVSREFMYKLGATCIATRDRNDKLIALGTIENLPSVRPAQKTGKWIKACTEEKYISLRDKITVSTYMCSECGRMINNIGTGPFASRIEGYPYCHCGAKMIGVEK